jgi:hypothetical protein
MFEEDEETKVTRYVGIALLAAGALWVGTYIVRSAQNAADERSARKLFKELAVDAGAASVAAGQAVMQPVQDATFKALSGMQEDFERREAERRSRLAAEREARQPKAYRWKDKDGVWHLSDAAPQGESAVEVIPLRTR